MSSLKQNKVKSNKLQTVCLLYTKEECLNVFSVHSGWLTNLSLLRNVYILPCGKHNINILDIGVFMSIMSSMRRKNKNRSLPVFIVVLYLSSSHFCSLSFQFNLPHAVAASPSQSHYLTFLFLLWLH